MADEVHRAPDQGSATAAVGAEVAGRRSDGGREVGGEQRGDATRGEHLAPAGQPLSALRPRSVGPAVETAADTWRRDHHAVCRRLHRWIPIPHGRDAVSGGAPWATT